MYNFDFENLLAWSIEEEEYQNLLRETTPQPVILDDEEDDNYPTPYEYPY